MIDRIFSHLTELMAAGFVWALAAAALWGVLSISLSPCHLSSIPLIIGYITSHEHTSRRQSYLLATIFAVGILITIAIVGLVTASLGRLIGDVGVWGNILVAAIFFIMGLYLLEIISLKWAGLRLSSSMGGYWGALGLGLIFGIGLGPCTFAYLAPVLGIVFSLAQSGWLKPMLLILAFALGHCAVIALAGGLSHRLQTYLHWSSNSRGLTFVKKGAGILVLLGGMYFIYSAFFQG